MRNYVLVCILLNLSMDASAQRPVKAWEWSNDQRLSLRADPTAAASRVRDAKPLLEGYVTQTGSDPVYDVIVGSRDAHLLLPFEIFGQLVRMGLAEDPVTRKAYRLAKDALREQLGLPSDMWVQLESIAAPYQASMREQRDYATRTIRTYDTSDRKSSKRILSDRVCRDRHAALSEAQSRFGRSFVRFLYEGVAADMVEVVLRQPDFARLRSVDGGCR